MKLAVFGATGRTGQQLVEQALTAGQSVVALVRDPAKLNLQHPNLRVVQGGILELNRVEEIITGVDAVISLLGPTRNSPDYVVSKGTANILAAMDKHGVHRLIVSAGAGIADPHDRPGLLNHVINFLLKVTSAHVYEDMRKTVQIVRASELDWTVVRVPMLTDQPKTGSVRVGYVGQGTGMRLSRADMADFMLREMEEKRYLRQSPVISN